MRRHLASLLLAAAGLTTVATAMAAAIDVNIAGVEGALKDNVAAFLSLKRYADAPDLDQDRVDRLALRARREATDALEPFGYYEAEATVTVTPQEQGGWKAVVAVVPGEPVILDGAEVSIRGPGESEPFLAEVLQGTTLAVGERLSHTDYDRLKGELQRVAASHGYLDASFPRHELRVDVENRLAQAFLTLDTGQRYRFGRTAIEQSFLDQDLVERYLRYDEDDWYDTQLLLRTQFALDDTDYFSVVEVLPDARDRDALTVPIRINGEKNKRYRYRVGVGYATDTEWRLLLGWTNRQLNRRGHRLSAEAKLSKIETSLDLNYVIPWDDPALEKLSFRPSLTQVRGRWQRVLFVNMDYTADSIPGGGSAEDDTNPTPLSVNKQRNFLLVPGISFALLPPGFVNVDATGRGLYAELLGSASALGSDSNFARLLVRDEHRLDLGGPWHLVLRGEAGTSAVGDFEELPAQYRFFAGGDRSVRGYGYNELSPTDAAGNKVGGRHLLVGSVEIEHDLPRNFGVAAFVDIGNAFDRFGDPLEYSAGIGIRYRLPFLILGLDVAQSLSESGRSPHIHLNFMPLL
jgi:translocation and assembly module TamA